MSFTLEDIIVAKYRELIKKPSRKALQKSLILGICYGIGEGATYSSFGLSIQFIPSKLTLNSILVRIQVDFKGRNDL